MISIGITPQGIDALHHERVHHPHPRVHPEMEAVYLKSQGLPHQEICRLARVTENALRAYLRQYQGGGIRRGLAQVRKFLRGMGPKFRQLGMIPAKADPAAQRKSLDERLRPRLKQARRPRRFVCFVDAAHFVHGTFLGCLWCFTRLPIRSPSGRKRFNVLGAIDAVTRDWRPGKGRGPMDAMIPWDRLGKF